MRQREQIALAVAPHHLVGSIAGDDPSDAATPQFSRQQEFRDRVKVVDRRFGNGHEVGERFDELARRDANELAFDVKLRRHAGHRCPLAVALDAALEIPAAHAAPFRLSSAARSHASIPPLAATWISVPVSFVTARRSRSRSEEAPPLRSANRRT